MKSMMLAMVAAVCMVFAACGGDDVGDGVQTPPAVPGGVGNSDVSNPEWVDLYMNWDATMDQVKTAVTGLGWTFVNEVSKVQTYTSTSHPNVVLNYGAPYTATLGSAQALYNNSSEDFYKWCINKVKTTYNAQVYQDGNYMAGIAKNVNGWNININIIYTPQTKMTMVQFRADEKSSSDSGEENPSTGEISQSDWVTPYINWTASLGDVKAALLTQGWTLKSEGEDWFHLTRDGHPNVEIEYGGTGNTNNRLVIFYQNSTLEYAKWAKDMLIAEYGLELNGAEDFLPYDSYLVLFKDKFINGKETTVNILYEGLNKEMTIEFWTTITL